MDLPLLFSWTFFFYLYNLVLGYFFRPPPPPHTHIHTHTPVSLWPQCSPSHTAALTHCPPPPPHPASPATLQSQQSNLLCIGYLNHQMITIMLKQRLTIRGVRRCGRGVPGTVTLTHPYKLYAICFVRVICLTSPVYEIC